MCNYCFLCNEEINHENDSREHIIKNSIGGRKKVLGFICRKCNSITGEKWDAEIDYNLGSNLSLLLGISRERGGMPKKEVLDEVSGKKYILDKGKIISKDVEYIYNENNEKITITAPNKERAKNFLQVAIKEIETKENIIIEKINSYFTQTEEKIYINTKFDFKIPEINSNFSKSIIKSALALLSENNAALWSCSKAKNFLLDQGTPCLNYIYTYDPIENRPFACPLHCVHVFSSDNKILAYVEIFGVARYYITLSDEYNAEEINITYSINPKTGEPLNIKPNFDRDIFPVIFDRNPMALTVDLLYEQNFEREVYMSFPNSIKEAMIQQENQNINIRKLGDDILKSFISNIIEKTNNKESYLSYMVLKFKELLESFYSEISIKS